MTKKKRYLEIVVRLNEGMFLHQEGFTLSDDEGIAASVGSTIPGQAPYVSIERGKNRGFYGADLNHLSTQIQKVVSGEIEALEIEDDSKEEE